MGLEAFGVDAATVASLKPQVQQYPNPVKGRVAHIDADFMAYQVSAESKEELDPEHPKPRKTLEEMKHNATVACDHIMRLAAAERAVLHTTGHSDKGGRAGQAILKPYQANREDRKNRPEHLDTIREFLGAGFPGYNLPHITGRNHTLQEADDGLTQALYADPENAILCSADKDLNMVPGWKLNMYDYTIEHNTDPFGSIWIDDSKSSKKLVGRGTKFFWAQCLMGDTADNVSGLPECPASMWMAAAGKEVKGAPKTKKCGPVLAFDLLWNASSDKQCFHIVRECYTRLASEHGYEYRHWQTGEVVSPTVALLSEMRLLWMRRTNNPDDVLDFVRGLK